MTNREISMKIRKCTLFVILSVLAFHLLAVFIDSYLTISSDKDTTSLLGRTPFDLILLGCVILAVGLTFVCLEKILLEMNAKE